MMVQNFMQQIKDDISSRREGKVPTIKFNTKMFNILTKNGFVVYLPGETTKIFNHELDSEKVVAGDVMSNLFTGYRPKELELKELKNQMRLTDYG